MKLSDYEFLPGNVIENKDPEKIGRVKASVANLFDNNVVPPEAMPWIYPLTFGGFQHYSLMEQNTKIWVIYNPNQPEEYWYIPMVDLQPSTKDKIMVQENSEVLMHRMGSDNDDSCIFFNDSDGMNICNGTSKIVIDAQKKIALQDEAGEISLNGGKVVLGKEESAQCMVLGENLQKLLQDLGNNIMNLGTLASGNPYTSHLGQPLIELGTKCRDAANDILSKTNKNS